MVGWRLWQAIDGSVKVDRGERDRDNDAIAIQMQMRIKKKMKSKLKLKQYGMRNVPVFRPTSDED